MNNKTKKTFEFRLDRLTDVMEEHEATIDDIIETAKEIGMVSYYDLNNPNHCRAYKKYIQDCFEGEDDFECEDLYVICKAVNVSADYLLGLSDKVN